MDYVTTKQAAEELGVDPSRVRQLILEGVLTAQKMGRDWVIKRADLKKAKGRPGPGRPKKAGDE